MSQGGAFRKLATTFIANDASTAIPVDNGLGSDLNIIGTGVITTTASGNTVTIASSGASSTTFTCDSGSAVPAANNLNVIGGGGAATSGSGSTITVLVPLSTFQFGGTASSFDVNTTTAIATIANRDFGTLELNVGAYQNGTTTYREGVFRCPDDVDPNGTVTFEIAGSAATAGVNKNVKFTWDFIEAGNGDPLTGSYGGAQIWDDQPISSTQDYMDIISNTETVSTLGLTGGKRYFWRLYLSQATTDPLAVYYDVIDFIGLIPRA